MFACNCGRSFATYQARMGHHRTCKQGDADPGLTQEDAPPAPPPPPAWVQGFGPTDQAATAAPPKATAAPPPPPPAPPAAESLAYIGQIPLPSGQATPQREEEPADDAEPGQEPPPPAEPEPGPAEPEVPAPPGSGGISIARMVGMVIDSHFGHQVRKLDADEKSVLAATFPDVPMAGGKGLLLVLFGIILPRMIEHDGYRAKIGEALAGLGRWIRSQFRSKADIDAQAQALRAQAQAQAAAEQADAERQQRAQTPVTSQTELAAQQDADRAAAQAELAALAAKDAAEAKRLRSTFGAIDPPPFL